LFFISNACAYMLSSQPNIIQNAHATALPYDLDFRFFDFSGVTLFVVDAGMLGNFCLNKEKTT